jgi:glycosyltransferase involved in cell wall biosynthesis
MRLLYIADALALHGGVERVLTQKVNWFAEHGYEACVVTVNQGNKPLCYSLHPNVSYYDLDVLFYKQYALTGWRRLFKMVKMNREFQKRLSDIITAYLPDVLLCTRLEYIRSVIRVKGSIPLIFESHSSCLCEFFEDDGLLRRLYMWYMKLSLKKVEMVIALTEGDAEEWKKYTSHVCVIPNVVALNPNDKLSDCSAKSIIFVGRLSKQKGIDSLLRIWLAIYQMYPEWQLNIYGDYGAEKNELLVRIKRMKSNIVIHEPTIDIYEKYKKNSILLLTSIYEPFGLVLPEAMSYGLPVVSFDCPYGPSNIIKEGVDGFLVKSGDIDGFVSRVCSLIQNHELRVKMGRAGAISSKRFDIMHIMPLWENLLSNIVKL